MRSLQQALQALHRFIPTASCCQKLAQIGPQHRVLHTLELGLGLELELELAVETRRT